MAQPIADTVAQLAQALALVPQHLAPAVTVNGRPHAIVGIEGDGKRLELIAEPITHGPGPDPIPTENMRQ